MESDGLAVLGILFEISEEDNENLTSVITGLQSIQSFGEFKWVNQNKSDNKVSYVISSFFFNGYHCL